MAAAAGVVPLERHSQGGAEMQRAQGRGLRHRHGSRVAAGAVC